MTLTRRHLLLASLAIPLTFQTALAAGKTEFYYPGLVKKHLAAGKTVLVDFHANWCGTCAVQARKIDTLRTENPAYDKNIIFVRVDWDEFGNSSISRKYIIPRRSTLLMLRGDVELGRVVAGTSTTAIKNLLDTGVT